MLSGMAPSEQDQRRKAMLLGPEPCSPFTGEADTSKTEYPRDQQMWGFLDCSQGIDPPREKVSFPAKYVVDMTAGSKLSSL